VISVKKSIRFQLKSPEIILICLLTILLSLPAVIGLGWNNDDALQKMENRKMAQCPSFELLQNDPKKFINSFDAFLKDRIGFRHFANKIYRKIRYYVFKDAPLHNISIGKDGFVFLNSHRLDKPNFIFNLLCEQQVNPSRELIASMDQTFTNVSRYYKSRGYDVTIVAAPTNVALYPDKLPTRVDKKYRDACISYGTSDTLLFQLENKSQEHKQYKLHYPFRLFKEHRDEPYFFPKEKWHWTGRSTYLFARNLAYRTNVLKELKIDDPAVPELVSDDLLMFFGFERRIKALTYSYDTFHTRTEYPDWQYDLSNRGGLTRYSTSNALSNKRALLLGNSFGIELAPHLARIFKDLYYFNLNDIRKNEEALFFSKIAELTKPDHIYILFDDAGIVAAPKRLAAFTELLRQEAPQ